MHSQPGVQIIFGIFILLLSPTQRSEIDIGGCLIVLEVLLYSVYYMSKIANNCGSHGTIRLHWKELRFSINNYLLWNCSCYQECYVLCKNKVLWHFYATPSLIMFHFLPFVVLFLEAKRNICFLQKDKTKTKTTNPDILQGKLNRSIILMHNIGEWENSLYWELFWVKSHGFQWKGL